MTHQPPQAEPTNSAPRGWRFTRRNLAAAAAIFAASMTTQSNKSAAHWRRHRTGGGHCFLAGTSILTPSGEVEINKLRVGDLVTTRSGVAKPIVRIQATTYSREANSAWSADVIPVVIKRGALDTEIPHRDLFVSERHSLFLDGVLIPAGDLVNGETITYAEVDTVDYLEYFHIELPEHDAVIADGALCESLLLANEAEAIAAAPFAPVWSIGMRRAKIKSRLRSALSPALDFRNRLDIVRDRLEDRADVSKAA